MFGLDDDVIRSSIAYRQSTLLAGGQRRPGPFAGAVRRAIGSFVIRLGEHLQGEARPVSGTARAGLAIQ